MNERATDIDAVSSALGELERQRRLIDQLLTMHARLRDRDQAVGIALVCSVLIVSLVGVAFAFAGSNPLVTVFGLTARRATWLGWLAVGTAAMALVELVLDRRGAAQRRADAVRMLGSLKAEYRVPPAPGEEIREAARISERYLQVMESIPAVPDRAFNRLKAAHLMKVEVSKVLSATPGISHRKARKLVAARSKERRP